jgi:hypothetical protein
MKKRRYGIDVYTSYVVQILVYGFALYVLLKRFSDHSLPVDPVTLTAIVTPLCGNIMAAINGIRLQWQTNNAHQRVNAMKGNANHLPAVLP